MKIQSLFFSLLLCLSACTTPQLLVSNDLKSNTTVMAAKGRQGWQFNQVIRYGDYTTSKVKRGWTRSSDIKFVVRFQKAQNKLSFTQMTPDNQQAEVLAVGKFQNNELELLNGFMSISLKYENTFAGTILPNDKTFAVWDFIIHNPDASMPRDIDLGLARNDAGDEILIRGVKKLEGQGKWAQFDNLGFEFIHNGQSIGAVSTLNNGQVWMKNDVSPQLKLAVSSISTSLLVRHSLQNN